MRNKLHKMSPNRLTLLLLIILCNLELDFLIAFGIRKKAMNSDMPLIPCIFLLLFFYFKHSL